LSFGGGKLGVGCEGQRQQTGEQKFSHGY
jgi:hypothetical protein